MSQNPAVTSIPGVARSGSPISVSRMSTASRRGPGVAEPNAGLAAPGSPISVSRMNTDQMARRPAGFSVPTRQDSRVGQRAHSPLPNHAYPLEARTQCFPSKVDRGAGSTTGSIAGSTEGSSSGFTGSTTVPSRLLGSQDELSVNQGKQSYTSLQSELKELRSTLEKKRAQHQQIGAMVETKLAGNDEQRIAKHVQQVQQVASQALEHEVKELCATVASQQAEQAIFLQMLMGEIDTLRDQVHAVRELDHLDAYQNLSTATAYQIDELRSIVTGHQHWKSLQEKAVQGVHSEIESLRLDCGTLKNQMRATVGLAGSPQNSIDPEIRQMLLEVDSKSTQSEAQVKLLHAEVQRMQALSAQRQHSSGLADDVDRLVCCIDDLKTNHGKLIAAVDSEVKSLRQEMGGQEVQRATGVTEKMLAEFRSSVAEMERKQKKQDEDYIQSMKRSNDLTMQMQADMNYLRDLLERNSAMQQDKIGQQESLEMTRTLQTEIEQLRRKHDQIGTELANKDASMTIQAQAELRELRIVTQALRSDVEVVQQQLKEQTAQLLSLGARSKTAADELRSATEAQRLDVDALRQQLNEQKAQLSALGSASKAVAGVREAEAVSMRQAFEQQVQQHAESIKSLNTQVVDLSDFTKQAIASLQQPPMQPVLDAAVQILGQDSDISKLKGELDALKLQSTMQRSLQATEVAKEAAAIHGQLHKVVGSEREARVQDSTEMRALIKKLFEEMAQLTQNLKLDRASDSSAGSRSGTFSGGYPTELLEPMEIKRLVTTDLSFGVAPREGVDKPP